MINHSARLGMMLLAAGALAPAAANAQSTEADALALLKAMSDYIGSQTAIETTVDTSIEIVTPDMEKIGFVSTSTLKMQRPDKVRLERSGGYATVDFIYDGANFTVRDRVGKRYSQVAVKGTTDDLVDTMHNELGMAVPGADLLLRDSYSILVADVIEAKVIGEGVIAGQACDHVAFRNLDSDWQLWIRKGPEKAPCKMVITSKTVGMAPQYITHVRSWNTKPSLKASDFAFKPEAGETRIDLGQMDGIDEVPTMSGSAPK